MDPTPQEVQIKVQNIQTYLLALTASARLTGPLARLQFTVENQDHVHGKTSLYQKINNETGASLDLKTYKKPCIPDLKQKYTR